MIKHFLPFLLKPPSRHRRKLSFSLHDRVFLDFFGKLFLGRDSERKMESTDNEAEHKTRPDKFHTLL
jgi:hypothetical protein